MKIKRLKVLVSPKARNELLAISEYNRENYGDMRAQSYEAFLISGIKKLATTYLKGRPVEDFAELRSVTLKRRTRGDGHIVIYEIMPAEVNILHLFHTKMDVQGRLGSERR